MVIALSVVGATLPVARVAEAQVGAGVTRTQTANASAVGPDDGVRGPAPNTVAMDQPLTAPPLLRNESHVKGHAEFTLVASPIRLALRNGATTAAYAYNGRVPGPTLEVYEGDRVTIHFRNELPEPTTIHWHGLHVPVRSDGSPLYPVPPHGRFEYTFTVPAQAAGTYWYHPHPDMRGGYQLASGLYGALIVRSRADPLRAFPEKLLILADNRFRADGSMDFPDPDSPEGEVDAENGREGDVVFVNGQVSPRISIAAGEVQRWRVVNASAARVYRLALQGQYVLHVGSDGGLFERPVPVVEILLANSERVELLVRGEGEPGSRSSLQALPYDRYDPHTRPADWDRTRDLATLEHTSPSPVAPATIPAILRHIPPLDTTRATATQVVVLSQGLINGHTMDMHRVDARGRLGETEIWRVQNVVGMDHPFHLHGFQFQVLDRDGVPEPFRSWKDTVNVPKHSSLRFIVHYTDYPGKWMFHCHIMDHEDHGMMAILDIR